MSRRWHDEAQGYKALPFRADPAHIGWQMQIHGSCASRLGNGVLLVGPPGSGKSDLILRLLGRGFALVADDRVEIADGIASAPPALAGLLEVRGLGIFRLAFVASTRLALVAELGVFDPRLPTPSTDTRFGLPLVRFDAAAAS